MKTFNNFKDAMLYTRHILDEAKPTFLGIVAEQIYKDSNEFTYRESGDMYQSGESYSQFNKGIIIEKTPYVRRRYYEGGSPGAGNKQAQPRWFDKTIAKYNEKYKKSFGPAVNQAKKGG